MAEQPPKKFSNDTISFGLDIGGTLSKVVYFEPQELTDSNSLRVHNFITNAITYGKTGERDEEFEISLPELGYGKLHFIKFETRRMNNFLSTCKKNQLIVDKVKNQVAATGGGAHKFENDFKEMIGVDLKKEDEIESLVMGINFLVQTVPNQCYILNNTNFSKGDEVEKIPYHLLKGHEVLLNLYEENNQDSEVNNQQNTQNNNDDINDDNDDTNDNNNDNINDDDDDKSTTTSPVKERKNSRSSLTLKKKNEKEKVEKNDDLYPYIVCNLGSGVSILKVTGDPKSKNVRSYERIGGSSLGGATFLGLCSLLCENCTTFKQAIELAEEGDSTNVDMLVKDIYGGSYNLFGLPDNLVASSFGKMVNPKYHNVSDSDKAKAALIMLTNNIGSVVHLHAKLENVTKVIFVGNFLRNNLITRRALTYAMNFWSNGKIIPIFLNHEGYFGAVGALILNSTLKRSTENQQIINNKPNNNEDTNDEVDDDENHEISR
eukprot:TRINITY_DN15204_c0_g1_i1.p1 TRINITY_DN15204_c0_g1~~TRINITY_DN15204_c0_g1_i1.p1  ORF type:complete len:490 (-),score=169.67 TRINITY_DN15204_c0_g1_i1:18-1487(-)